MSNPKVVNHDGKEVETSLNVKSTAEWRSWLKSHCNSEKHVWLVIHNKRSPVPSVRWHDAIEHALCFGWVDSKAMKRDRESCYLKFTPRNPKSTWGKRNKERAQKMIEQGLMTENGKKLIEIAKSTGKWEL